MVLIITNPRTHSVHFVPGIIERRSRFEEQGVVAWGGAERKFFIDKLLVRIHVIIEMILVDRPDAIGVSIPIFQIALYVPSCQPPNRLLKLPWFVPHDSKRQFK